MSYHPDVAAGSSLKLAEEGDRIGDSIGGAAKLVVFFQVIADRAILGLTCW